MSTGTSNARRPPVAKSMSMLVVRIRGVGMRVRTLLVTVRVAVLAVERRIVEMVVMPVVVAVRVLVLQRMVRVQMAVLLRQVEVDSDPKESRCSERRQHGRSIAHGPRRGGSRERRQSENGSGSA